MVGAGVPVNKVFALKDMPAIGVPVGTPEEETVGAIVIGAGGGVGATGAGAGAGGGVGAGVGATYAAAIEIARVKFAVTPFAPVTVIVIVEVPADTTDAGSAVIVMLRAAALVFVHSTSPATGDETPPAVAVIVA